MELNEKQQMMAASTPRSYPTSTRWMMKQAWPWSDMDIEDEAGNVAFRAESKPLGLRWDLNFLDAGNREVIGQIQQNLQFGFFRFGMPEFVILIDGAEYATVKKRFSLPAHKFDIFTVDGDSISVIGDFLAHEFRFERAGQTVAQVSKVWVSLRDIYTANIMPGENVLFILACCIAIDKCRTQIF